MPQTAGRDATFHWLSRRGSQAHAVRTSQSRPHIGLVAAFRTNFDTLGAASLAIRCQSTSLDGRTNVSRMSLSFTYDSNRPALKFGLKRGTERTSARRTFYEDRWSHIDAPL